MRVLGALFAMSLAFASAASAAAYLVRPDGTGDYPTIQAAINAAADGDTVELADGIFSGLGNRDIDFLGKAILVRSQAQAPESCVINCSYLGRGFSFHTGEDSSSVLRGVTITNGYIIYQGKGGGIYCEGASPTIEDCRIVGNVVGQEGGGLYLQSSMATMRRCFVRENISFGSGGGMRVLNSELLVEDCQWDDNRASGVGGGMALDASTVEMTGCDFSADSSGAAGGAIYCQGTPLRMLGCVLVDNRSHSGGGAIYCTGGSPLTIVQCSLERNGTWNGDGGAIECEDSQSVALLSGCQFTANAAGMAGGNHGGGGLWAACCTLMEACGFVGNSAMYGGGAFFQGGEPEITDCNWHLNVAPVGGGVYCQSTPAHMAFCTFWMNSSVRGGGCYFLNCSPTLETCTLVGNSAGAGGAGLCLNSAHAMIHRCIVAFSPEGMGIEVSSSEPTLVCCDVFGNDGGDWVGGISNQYGLAGNIALDPWFCDAESGDFHLCADSPCAPFSPPNEECDLIGAFGIGCAPMGLSATAEHGGARLSLWPNPMAGTAQIRYVMPSTGERFDLAIYDLAGRLVRRLTRDGEASGTVMWDGTDAFGHPVNAGSYSLRLRVGDGETTRQVVVVR